MKTTTNTILTIIAVVLVLTTSSFASLVSTTGSSGGGFGVVSGNINQSISMNGFNISLHGENRPAGTETWTDYETGETYQYSYPQCSYGSLNFSIEQGAMSKYYAPIDSSAQIYRWDDKGHFNISTEFTLLLNNNETRWSDLPKINTNWDAFGIHYNLNSYVQHEEQYIGDDQWAITNDLYGSSWFNFQDSTIKNGNLSLNDTDWWYQGNQMDALRIGANFDVQFMGSPFELSIFNASTPMMAIPEPATITILALGGLLLRKRK